MFQKDICRNPLNSYVNRMNTYIYVLIKIIDFRKVHSSNLLLQLLIYVHLDRSIPVNMDGHSMKLDVLALDVTLNQPVCL